MESDKKKYIGAFLDGYFSEKNLDYGIQYHLMLENAIDLAEKKWKKYKKKRNYETKRNRLANR